MYPDGEKELPETRKEKPRPPLFLDIPTLFLATSAQRKEMGGSACTRGCVCILGREVVTLVGGGRARTEQKLTVLILAPIPALGMGNIASMLSPKGKPGKGNGLRGGTKGTDREGEGWEGRRQPGSCQPSWEGEELDVGYPRQEIGVFH